MTTSVGSVSVDFQAGIAQLVSGVDQVNAKLSTVGNSMASLGEAGHIAERSLAFLTRFALGGGLAVGFAGLINHLDHLAEKLGTSSPAAKEFAENMDHIRSTVQQGAVGAFEALNPLLGQFAVAIGQAGQHVSDMVDSSQWKRFIDELKFVANFLAHPSAGALFGGKSLEVPGGMFGGTGVLGAMIGEAMGMAGRPQNYVEVPPEQRGLIDRSAAQAKYAEQWAMIGKAWKAYNDAKWEEEVRTEEELVAKQLDDMGIVAEKQRRSDREHADRMFQLNNAAYGHFLANIEKESDVLAKQDKEREAALKREDDAMVELDKMGNERFAKLLEHGKQQAEAFGDLFAENLVQAADGGFKSVLRSWALTLEQMALKAAASKLWETLFKQGIENTGFWGTVIGAFGFGSGAQPAVAPGGSTATAGAVGADFVVRGSGGPDSKALTMAVSPGERIRITPPMYSQMETASAGNVTIVNNNSFLGNMDRGDYLRLLEANRQQTLADVRRETKRRWNK